MCYFPENPERRVLYPSAYHRIGVTVLCYHHVDCAVKTDYSVTSAQLNAQIYALLKEGFTFIDSRALEDVYADDFHIPAKSVLITFDDGNYDVYRHAYPLLKKRKIPFTFFVYPNAVNAGHEKHCVDWADYFIELATAPPIYFSANVPFDLSRVGIENTVISFTIDGVQAFDETTVQSKVSSFSGLDLQHIREGDRFVESVDLRRPIIFTQLDTVIKQSAGSSEQTARMAEELSGESTELKFAISCFNLGGDTPERSR